MSVLCLCKPARVVANSYNKAGLVREAERWCGVGVRVESRARAQPACRRGHHGKCSTKVRPADFRAQRAVQIRFWQSTAQFAEHRHRACWISVHPSAVRACMREAGAAFGFPGACRRDGLPAVPLQVLVRRRDRPAEALLQHRRPHARRNGGRALQGVDHVQRVGQ